MQYAQCKCGEHKCWTSMGFASCDVCTKCGSALGYGPNSHPEPTPHEVYVEIANGKLRARCTHCQATRPLSEARNLEQFKATLDAYQVELAAAGTSTKAASEVLPSRKPQLIMGV